MRLLLSSSLVALLAIPAAADTLRVPREFDTIQLAVDAATPGDTVVISRGVYTEGVVLNERSGFTIRGQRGSLIDGENTRVALSLTNCSDIVITGLATTRSSGDGMDLDFCTDITITRCQIEFPVDDGIDADHSTRITITRCTVLNGQAGGFDADDTNFLRVERCRVDNVALDGVELSVGEDSTTNDSVIQANRLNNCGDDAVDLNGSRNLVARNRCTDMGEDGLEIDDASGESERNEFLRNVIKNAANNGILMRGNDSDVVSNRIIGCGTEGIDVDSGSAVGNRIFRNIVSKALGDGIQVEGPETDVFRNRILSPGNEGVTIVASDCIVDRNTVSKAGGDAFRVEADASGTMLTRNVSIRATGNGFTLLSGDSTLRGNRAARSGGFDLFEDTLESNDIDRSNRFRTRGDRDSEDEEVLVISAK